MLTALSIKGLAIVEQLSITTASGFNVITGETGAGKSILIKALGLLLGHKASADAVRNGFDQALICGTFYLSAKHPARLLAEELSIPFESEHDQSAMLMIRRSLHANGKSSAWLNDVPVTLSSLKNLAPYLIDIYAQHETGRLLDVQTHTMILDQFLTDSALPAQYRQAFKKCSEILDLICEKLEFVATKAREKDYLQYRFEELKRFEPTKEDYERLVTLLEKLENMNEHKELMQNLSASLQTADGQSITDHLAALIRMAGRAKVPESITGEIIQLAQQARDTINELSYRIESSLAGDLESEEDLETLQDRLGQYHDFFRKFGVKDISEFLQAMQALEADLRSLDGIATEVAALLLDLQKETELAWNRANKLTKQRQAAAKAVSQNLETELEDLAMPNAKLHVAFSAAGQQNWTDIGISALGSEQGRTWQQIEEKLKHLSIHGREKARFLLSANKGEEAKPLDKVASGGELSRIMLAVKKALSAGADSCVLVFDEIDSGISGRVADIVGKKIHELSKKFQVICISHLPQVAAYADSHFKVEKKTIGKRTESSIFELSPEDRVRELARLLSGEEITEESLANAKRLLIKAQNSLSQKPAKKNSKYKDVSYETNVV